MSVAVPPSATASVWVPVLFQYQMPASLVMVAPLASVMPLVTNSPPLTVRLRLSLLPRVTPFSVGLPMALRAVPLLEMMVPPMMAPATLPFTNSAEPTSSVLPVFVRVPCSTTWPPVRLIEARLATE